MKKIIALTLALALSALMAIPTLAAPGDTLLFPSEDISSYSIDAAVVVGDTIYASVYNEGVYAYTMGDAEPRLVVDMDGRDFTGQADPSVDMTNEEREEYYQKLNNGEIEFNYLQRLIGGDMLIAIDSSGKALWKLNEAEGKFEVMLDISKSPLRKTDGDYSQMIYMQSAICIDGKIYFTYEEEARGSFSYKLGSFDIETSTMVTFDNISFEEQYIGISSVAAYQPGKLLVGVGEYGSVSSIGVVDTAAGTYEEKLKLYDRTKEYKSYAGLAYDAELDAIYMNCSGEILRSINFGEPEVVAYAPVTSMHTDNCALLPGGMYMMNTTNGLAIRNVDPQYKPASALRICGFEWSDVVQKFTRDNPAVPISADSFYPSNAEELAGNMNSGDTASDVYAVYTNSVDLDLMYERGYLGDMSDDPEILAAVRRMYPDIQDLLIRDGKLIGIPLEFHSTSMGYSPKAFEELGIPEEDIPTTYMELLDFIDKWHREYSNEHTTMSLFEEGEYAQPKNMVLGMILSSQMTLCAMNDEMLTFDTPTMHQLLNRLDSIDFSSYYNWEDNATVSVSYESSSNYVFSSYYTLTPNMYGRNWYSVEMKPLVLSMDENTPPTAEGYMRILVLNPKAQNRDMAIELIRYCALNMDASLKIATIPDENTPFESQGYKQNAEYRDKEIAALNERLEKTEDENDKKQLQQSIDETIASFSWVEEDRWAVSEEDIAEYRAIYDNIVISKPNILYAGGEATSEIQDLLMRYYGGNLNADQFLVEISQKLRMMALEG